MKFDSKKKLMAAVLAGTVAIGAGMGASSAYAARADRESIAQVALLQSLAQGYFGGTVTAGQLRKLGDTGIGTFEGLNGEMTLATLRQRDRQQYRMMKRRMMSLVRLIEVLGKGDLYKFYLMRQLRSKMVQSFFLWDERCVTGQWRLMSMSFKKKYSSSG